MDTNPAPAHVHPAALSVLLARDTEGRPKSAIAAAAEFTPANVREFETGVRTAARLTTRQRIADALDVPVGAITCWCPRPGDRCLSLGEPS